MTAQPPDDLQKWLPKLLAVDAADVNHTMWEWGCPVDRVRFKQCHTRLEKVVAWKSKATGKQAQKDKGRRSRAVGKIFEKLLRILFDGRGALEVEANVRSTTNEIDLLIKVNPVASFLPVVRAVGTHVIGEAKCHQEAPSSTLVNGLVGFLQLQNATVGLLFVYCSSRPLESKCRTSIALHWKDGFKVVPFGRKQLEEIRNGVPFLKILNDQHIDAANHAVKLHV